jgi:hypothetical protein
VVKRAKKLSGARLRPGVERLEDRQLLTTLLEGLGANHLAGTTVTPLGNVFDDSTAGLVGEDFAVASPGAANSAGEIYVIFGGPHLNPTPALQQGCIAPPARVQSCSLIDTFLTNRVALRITGARAGDLAGFSVAGLGNAIGDSRPDLLIGAPFALNSGGVSTGRAYLIGGDYIADVISAARSLGGSAVANINLAAPDAAATLRTFDGLVANDQAGNSVAGLGLGNFIVGAPINGAAPKAERGAAYVFTSLRGVAGPGTLTPFSTVLGPSLNSHLGGVPVADFTTTGYRAYAVSGIRNPALIPVADELPADNRYDILDGFEPDVLVGAPDACVDNACTDAAAARNGLAYLLSGTALITIGGSYDLSVDTDLKALAAIPVQGVAAGDRFGSSVSGAGDLDGDGMSDFMVGAPNRDLPGSVPGVTLNNAGEIYVVFGREVNSTPYPNGGCQEDPGATTHQNFRQCRDATGLVIPLSAGNFQTPGRVVGLTLRGDVANERAGLALAEAGNFSDPTGSLAAVQPARVGVTELLIGAPFHDVNLPGQFVPAAGRAYVLFGSRDYATTSGLVRSLGPIQNLDLGLIFDGRTANDHYGISVSSAGDAVNPVGQLGDDILVGGNRLEVTLNGVVTQNVGEVELLFGFIGGGVGNPFAISPLPFIQPGPFGPQVFIGGFWSWTNQQPPAGIVVQPPQAPTIPIETNLCGPDIPLCPPFTSPNFPLGFIGPFVPANPYMGLSFLPDRPLAVVDRVGNLNVYGGPVTTGGANVTATLNSPKLKPGAAVITNGNSSANVFAVGQSGHLIQHSLGAQGWYAVDLTVAANGPMLTGNVNVQQVGSASAPSYIVSGRSTAGETVIYGGNASTGWGTFNLSQVSGIPATGFGSTVSSLNVNYAVNASGHVVEYRPSKRRWLTTDITAIANGPALQGDVSSNVFVGGGARATIEVFGRGEDGHLIRYYRAGKLGWRFEDVSAQASGGVNASLNGSIMTVSRAFGSQRFVYAQAGGRIIEFTSDLDGWHSTALPLPTGVSSVIGPIASAETSGGSRVIFAYSSSGSLVQFTSDGTTWTTRELTPGVGNSLADILADLGTLSR